MELDLTPTSNTSQTKSTNDTNSDESNDTPPYTSHNLLSFTKNNHTHHLRHHGTPEEAAVTYKECLKNHAAAIGGHAVDGCGEFMPPPKTGVDPTSLKCAACGCHRNFHRREPATPTGLAAITPPFLDFRRPPPAKRFSLSHSPPPTQEKVSSVLKLFRAPMAEHTTISTTVLGRRKRFRTKFSQEQKDKMLNFAEKMGWKLQKWDEEKVRDFCSEIGVTRGVLKVWMHNNKNTSTNNGTDTKDTILMINTHDHNDGDNNMGFAHNNPHLCDGNNERDVVVK